MLWYSRVSEVSVSQLSWIHLIFISADWGSSCTEEEDGAAPEVCQWNPPGTERGGKDTLGTVTLHQCPGLCIIPLKAAGSQVLVAMGFSSGNSSGCGANCWTYSAVCRRRIILVSPLGWLVLQCWKRSNLDKLVSASNSCLQCFPFGKGSVHWALLQIEPHLNLEENPHCSCRPVCCVLTVGVHFFSCWVLLSWEVTYTITPA